MCGSEHIPSVNTRVLLISYSQLSLHIASFVTWTQGARNFMPHLSVGLQMHLTCQPAPITLLSVAPLDYHLPFFKPNNCSIIVYFI